MEHPQTLYTIPTINRYGVLRDQDSTLLEKLHPQIMVPANIGADPSMNVKNDIQFQTHSQLIRKYQVKVLHSLITYILFCFLIQICMHSLENKTRRFSGCCQFHVAAPPTPQQCSVPMFDVARQSFSTSDFWLSLLNARSASNKACLIHVTKLILQSSLQHLLSESPQQFTMGAVLPKTGNKSQFQQNGCQMFHMAVSHCKQA